MAKYVGLLRGVNVGGRKRVAMRDVREALGALGYGDVETHWQPGNAVFTTTAADGDALASEIEEELRGRVGIDVKVLVRTPDELAAVVEANPFPEATAEPSKLHVAFLSATPDAGRLAAIDAARFESDQLRIGERAVYLWYPNGAGRSKLTNDLLERKLRVTATSRNWNTVLKLLDRAASG